jgi:hypothetical protein
METRQQHKTSPPGRVTVFSVRLNAQEHNLLEKLAAQVGATKGGAVRELLRAATAGWLDQEAQQQP